LAAADVFHRRHRQGTERAFAGDVPGPEAAADLADEVEAGPSDEEHGPVGIASPENLDQVVDAPADTEQADAAFGFGRELLDAHEI